jgi:hypothetical protein
VFDWSNVLVYTYIQYNTKMLLHIVHYKEREIYIERERGEGGREGGGGGGSE